MNEMNEGAVKQNASNSRSSELNESADDKHSGKLSPMHHLKFSLAASVAWLLAYVQATTSFYRSNPVTFRKELLSGFTVAILQVPESVAFSYVAGVHPMSGLYSTAFLGTITGLIGGRPAQISGAAGAMAVVLTDLTSDNGPLGALPKEERIEHLLMTIIIVGAMQTILGVIQVARLVSLIPETGMIGFLNGLALIIAWAQRSTFFECKSHSVFTHCKQDDYEWMSFAEGSTWMVILLIILTMVIMHFWPKVPTVGHLVPASLVAVLFGAFFEHVINRRLFGWNVRTVGETAQLGGDLPPFGLPEVQSEHWGTIIRKAVSLAAIGLIESVMTLQAVDEITETRPSNFRNNQECIAQGIGNFVCGWFGGMGGDAMIGQSTINVMNGARYRLSAVTAGLLMFVIILVASPAIEVVPIASLTGVLFTVVMHTFNWDTFHLFTVISWTDSFGIVLVTVLAVVTDLAIAVISGVVWTALCNSWQSGKLMMSTETTEVGSEGQDVKVYSIEGPLFFGSVSQFGHLFSPASDPNHVYIDLRDSLICDFSAVAAIRSVCKRYEKFGKEVTLRHMCKRSHHHVARAKTWIRGQNLLQASDQMEKATSELSLHEHRPALGAPNLSQIVDVHDHHPEITLEMLAKRHEIDVESSDSERANE